MNCSAVPCTTPSPRPSDHRPRGRPEINRGRAGQTGGSAMPAHHRTHTKDQQRASLEINGGSRLIGQLFLDVVIRWMLSDALVGARGVNVNAALHEVVRSEER